MVRFAGSDYIAALDDRRLTSQIQRIFYLMNDECWRTLSEIAEITQDPPASVSAQLRHLRKKRFGGHTVNKRIRGDRTAGLYEYQLETDKKPPEKNLHLPFHPEIALSGNKGILKCRVLKRRWNEIDERMRGKGYTYQGDGIWIRGN